MVCPILLIYLILRGVVIAPLQVQSVFVRVLEPLLWSGLMFFLLEVSARPILLILTVLLVALLLGSLVWQHASMAKQTRKVTGSGLGGLLESMAVATATGYDDVLQDNNAYVTKISQKQLCVFDDDMPISVSSSSGDLHSLDDDDVMGDEEYSMSSSSSSADSRSSGESKDSSSGKLQNSSSCSSSLSGSDID